MLRITAQVHSLSSHHLSGGYHPVTLGDNFQSNRYIILRKLGWGHFSTVWLAKDKLNNSAVALKIVKSAKHYTETAYDEIKLLSRVVSAKASSPYRKYVVELLDSFEHRGPHGKRTFSRDFSFCRRVHVF